MTRIFHTADVHVGLKFGNYPDDLRERLREARIEVLIRMVAMANAESCDLFVVAGDLFDNRRVTKTEVKKAAEAISAFDGVAVVLPGNHDFYEGEDDEFWKGFANALGDNHLLLRESETYDLGDFELDGVMLYPGVCGSKHSSDHAVGWVKAEIEAHDGDQLRIGIAHGSLEGISPDFEDRYFPMQRRELLDAGVDLWLLGHTHIRVPDCESGSDEELFYPSVPEPDGFRCDHSGFAWILEAEPGGELTYRSVDTGRFRFRHSEVAINSIQDVEAMMDSWLGEFDSDRDLVKVRLRGCLEAEALEALETVLKKLPGHVLNLRDLDRSDLLKAIQQEDIDREFTEHSFPHRLLSALVEDESDRLALQLARELIEEVQS